MCVIINNYQQLIMMLKFLTLSIFLRCEYCWKCKNTELNWIGIGANIINNINIGKSSMIGAGSIILSNIKPYSKIVGVHK